MATSTHKLAVLPGDYIGPEVMGAARTVIDAAAKRFALDIVLTEAEVGGAAIDAHGEALPAHTIKLCEQSDAILFGSVGGPKWEHLPPEQQPERAALLPLRRHFSLFANLRPAVIFPDLVGCSPLRGHLQGGIDILIIRELTSGIYFADPKARTAEYALDTLRYERPEIERIAHVAFAAAATRDKVVTSVDKANVLQSMCLWRDVVSEVAASYPQVELRHMYVDNAAMQLILNPGQFDVILCPNMFGDILSDEAAALPGSLGMQPSASLAPPSGDPDTTAASVNFGLYEPAGGSAPDIAGKNIANPIAQILSTAMLFKFSLGRDDIYQAIYAAVESVLASGARTADLAGTEDTPIGTAEMGQEIAAQVAQV